MEATGLPVKEVTKSRFCDHCHRQVKVLLVRTVSSSGVDMPWWQCTACNKPADAPIKFISHKLIKQRQIEIKSLPAVRDYHELEHCAVCGSAGTEYHHFAPRHLFGEEADNWPTAYLCKKHHDTWHDLVTPNMGKRRRPQEI